MNIQGIISVDLINIKQTSGCLSAHAYEYLMPFAFCIKCKSILQAFRHICRSVIIDKLTTRSEAIGKQKKMHIFVGLGDASILEYTIRENILLTS